MQKKNSIYLIVTSIICGTGAIILGKYIFIPLFPLTSLFCLIFSKKVYNSYFSPIGIMGVSWLIPSLSTFLDPRWDLKEITWFVILGSFLMFFGGILFVSLKWPSVKIRNIKYIKKIKPWKKAFLDKTITFLFLLGLIGFVINFSFVLKSGGVSIYFEKGFRAAEYIFARNTLINYLYFLNMLVVPFVAFRLVVYGRNFKSILLGLLSFFFLFFHGIRGTIIFAAVITLWIWILKTNHLRVKHLIILITIGVLGFSFVTVGREPSKFLSGELNLTEIVNKIYNYIAPNYANLQQELMLRNQYLLGQDVFGPLIQLFSFRQIKLQIEYHLASKVYVIGTYLKDYIVDFGVAGIVVAPFLIGCITTLFFLIFLKNPSQCNLFIYSIIATMITFSFWYNEFLRIQFLYFMAIIYLIELIRRTYYRNIERMSVDNS